MKNRTLGNRIAMLGAALLCTVSIPAAWAATVENLSIVSNGEIVGSVKASTQDDHVSVDYFVDNNGRGPKHHEEIALGKNGVPVRWNVSGTSLMGGAVEESFDWKDGEASWKSQADAGSVKAVTPPLYVLNDDSPFAMAIYARAVLASAGDSLPVVPGGKLTVTKVRELTIGEGASAVPVTVYRLRGIQLAPTYVLFDANRALFAVLSPGSSSGGGLAVRAGHETSSTRLGQLEAELELDRVQQLQQQLAHRYDTPVRIDNVHIFDPRTGARSPLSSVVVMRGDIVQVEPANAASDPDDETVIDGGGGTVYPGLHDMHSHASLDMGLFYLAAGVTSTRDMGNDNAFMQELLGRIDAGQMAWPRIVPSGFMEGRSPYSARMGFIPDTLDGALRDVRWYADHGYAAVKIYNSFNPDWVKPVAAEAHRRGLRVAGHVPAFDTPDRVIEDGYDAIAHINQLMLGWILDPTEDSRTPLRLTAMARAGALDLHSPRVRKTIDLMKSHGTALDTTAVILEMLMKSNAGETPSFAKHYFDHMPIGWQRFRKRSYVDKSDPATRKAYDDGAAKMLEVIKVLHDEGIRLLPGTDESTGLTVLRELELYVKAGLTPAEALRAGTLGSEEYLGRTDRLGTIEQGKQADLVLVAGDPAKDITAIYHPRMVMRGGIVYFPAEIHEALGITPFADVPQVRPARVSASAPTGGHDEHF